MWFRTSDFLMKKHVSVPGTSRMPWKSLPNSFAKLRSHILLYFSDFMRCRYSSTSPVSSSMTAPMKCLDAFAAEWSSLFWSRCAARAYPWQRMGVFVLGGGSCASVRTCSAMAQLIMCAVRAWRRVRAVVVEGAACARGERRRSGGGTASSLESSSMMAGRSRRRGGALAVEVVPVMRTGIWNSSGLQISTGSSSMMGRGAVTGVAVGSGGGTSPRRSVRRDWIAASSSGGASWTPLIAAVRRAVQWR